MSRHSSRPQAIDDEPVDPTDDPDAHPYVRISHPDQRKGGGLERQTSADLQEFCERHCFKLSRKVWVDDGVSAWDGSNLSKELGRFLDEVRRGLIRPGDCLVVENLDRIARHGRRGRRFMDEIQDLGVHVGVLQGGGKLYRADSEALADAILPMLEFHRGQSESDAKSERNRDKWSKKRDRARENGETITARLPAWVCEVDGCREAIAERAVVIKRMFQMAASGYGHALIVKTFTEAGVPPFKGEHWSRSYVALILKDRRVLGEFQPRLRSGEPAGDKILNYYPVVVSEDEFDAARGGAERRKNHHGRQGKHVNVFAGLLRNPLTGDSFYCATRTDGGKHTRVLVNTHAAEGRASMRSFPFATFEAAMLALLREIDPHQILNGDQGPDMTLALSGQLANVEHELAEAKAYLDAKGFNVIIGDHITSLTSKQKELTEKLRAARQKAEHPQSEVWGECQSLIDAIKGADEKNDVRLRIQAKLREMVESIQLLIVPRGRERLAVAQVWFAGGQKHRDYVILHRPARANQRSRREGGAWAGSPEELVEGGFDDLRRRKYALALADMLGQVDLSWLTTEDYRV
jgi:DNA invertase Pin-like site-specific DNA recombinase